MNGISMSEVVRDERTVAVENASYRVGFAVVTYGLLLDVMARSFFRGEAPWDLMALVILGGAVTTAYQASRRILTRRSAFVALGGMVLAAALGAAVAMFVGRR